MIAEQVALIVDMDRESTMAFRQIRVSDLSGEVIPDDKVVEVTIRSHPDLEDAKRFDSQPAELKDLRAMDGLVELELKSPSGATGTMYILKEDFDAVIPPEKVATFDSTRGGAAAIGPTAADDGQQLTLPYPNDKPHTNK